MNVMRSLIVAFVPLLLWSSPANSASPVLESLRVCADPANLPYSDDQQRGFENQIATLVARELHVKLTYTWWAQRRGFFRNTLNAGKCDVVIGVPLGLDMVRTTDPYYRSSFAFVSRREHGLADLRSLDDARLHALKIGVPLAGDDGANPAPVLALNRRGIFDNLVGFSLWGEYQRDVPAAVDAVAQGAIDLALLWGPVAGAGAKRSRAQLVVVPIREQRDAEQPLAFSIAMGVRKDDEALGAQLNAIISRKRHAILRILSGAGVPLLALPQAGEHAAN
jgi:quinoprotein dehydrogenase-associated probable ABC transporter substrate-binding protein